MCAPAAQALGEVAKRYKGKGLQAILIALDRDPKEVGAYMVIPRPFIGTTDQYGEARERYGFSGGLTILIIGKDRKIKFVGRDDVNERLLRTHSSISRILDGLLGPNQ